MKPHLALKVIALLLAAGLYSYCVVYTPWLNLHSNDFKHMYLGMKALYAGLSPYPPQSLFAMAADAQMGNVSLNPYVYLPFTGLSLGFLAPFSFMSAARIWFAINHALLLSSLALVACWFKPRHRVWVLAASLGMLSMSQPLYRTLTAGQLNLVLLFSLLVSFDLLRRSRDNAAAVVLGFATLFKLTPGIYLLWFLLQKRYRPAALMSAMIVLGLGLSVAVVGWRVHLDFLPMLQQMSYGRSTWQEHGAAFWKDPWNQSLNSFLTHILVPHNKVTVAWFSSTQTTANVVTQALTALMLVYWAYQVYTSNSRKMSPDAGFMLTSVVALLVPSLMWDHYLVALLMPAAWCMLHFRDSRSLACVTFGCFAATLVPFAPQLDWFRHDLGILFMSAKLWPTLAIFGMIAYYIQSSLRTLPTAVSERQPPNMAPPPAPSAEQRLSPFEG